MKKTKPFDCVEMKDEIQQRLAREYAGLSPDEKRRRLDAELASSEDSVARKWRALRQRAPQPTGRPA